MYHLLSIHVHVVKQDAALTLAFVRPVVQPYAAIRYMYAGKRHSQLRVSTFVVCGEQRMMMMGKRNY